LSDSDNGAGAQKHDDVATGSGIRGSFEDVSARTSPDQVLNDLQKSRQDYRAYTSSDSGAQRRQPKERGASLQEGGGYPRPVGLGRMI
jgi:hypothetical protein